MLRKGIGLALCVLVAGWLPLAAGQDPEWSETDASNDVAAAPGLSLPVPYRSHADLRGITVEGESADGWAFNITLGEFGVRAAPSGNSASLRMLVSFEVEGFDSRLHLSVHLEGTYTDVTAQSFAFYPDAVTRLCSKPDQGRCAFSPQPFVTRLFDGPNAVRVWVPKTAVATLLATSESGEEEEEEDDGMIGQGFPLPDLKAGNKLHRVRVSMEGGEQFMGESWTLDHMPDAGPSEKAYTFRHDAAKYTLFLFVDGGFSDARFYAPGETRALQLGVYVPAGPRRLLQFSYSVEGDAAEGFRLRGPANLSTAGGRFHQLTLSLQTPAEGGKASLVIRTTAYPSGELGVAHLAIQPGTPLGPNVTTLRAMREAQGGLGCGAEDCSTRGVLTVRSQVPGHASEGWILSSSREPDVSTISLELDRPIAAPIAWNPEGLIEITTRLRSNHVPREKVTVTATLTGNLYGSGPTFLKSEKEVDLPVEGTTVTFQGRPRNAKAVVAGGSELALVLEFKTEETPTPYIVRPFGADVAGLSVRLPLAPVPPEYSVPITPSPFQVHVLGEPQVFTQPGKTRLWNVTILNQNATEQRLRLETSVATPGWSAQVRPGYEFRLKSGDAVTVGLLLTAPATAVEGERGFVLLNATAEGVASNSVRVDATVATQIESPDQKHAFRADPEDEAKRLDRPSPGTPGPSVAALLLLGLCVVLRRRR